MFRAVLVAGLFTGAAGVAYSQQPAQQPAAPPATPPAQTLPAAQTPPGTPPGTPPVTAPAVPPIPATPATLAARTFTAECGFLLHPVRPERVADFERFLDYVRDALARTTNPRVRSQADGWRFFKASEPGPNGVALYVFWVDPVVPGAEYSLGPILNEVYSDPAQLNEIWTLYTSSVTSGGTLLNLTPVMLNPPQPILTPPVNAAPDQKPGAPAPAAPEPPAAAPAKPLPKVVLKC